MKSWTLKVPNMKCLQALEMWMCRRMMAMPWIDRVSNDRYSLQALNKHRKPLGMVKVSKAAYLGHIEHKYGLLQLIQKVKIEEKRGNGITGV